jgi:opacity protein-like surface antigen
VVETTLILLALFTVINTIDKNTEGVSIAPSTETNVLKSYNSATYELKNNSTEEKVNRPTFKTTTPNATNNVKAFDNSPNWRLRSGMPNKNGQKGQQAAPNAPQNLPQNQQPSLTPVGQPIVDNVFRNKGAGSVFNPQNLENAVAKADNTEGVAAQSREINLATNAVQNAEITALPMPNVTTQTLAEIVPPIDVLQANLLENNKLNVAPNIIKANTDKKAKWRLSTFGTAALDWVTTSFVDKDRVLNRQKQGVANFGINALVGYRRGKIEVETGVTFNQKKYSIANIELITGTVVSRNATKIEKPQDLRLSIVSIPLNVNVHLKETRRLNVYAHAGVATNAVVDALDRREIIKPFDLTNSYGPAPAPSEIETATYSKGLMNGGETKENVFFTTQIGAGLEYKLTPKASLFLQPTASFMLNKERGIGSLNDRIITYSIQGGAKWRL